jgi:hypothetical protein
VVIQAFGNRYLALIYIIARPLNHYLTSANDHSFPANRQFALINRYTTFANSYPVSEYHYSASTNRWSASVNQYSYRYSVPSIILESSRPLLIPGASQHGKTTSDVVFDLFYSGETSTRHERQALDTRYKYIHLSFASLILMTHCTLNETLVVGSPDLLNVFTVYATTATDPYGSSFCMIGREVISMRNRSNTLLKFLPS